MCVWYATKIYNTGSNRDSYQLCMYHLKDSLIAQNCPMWMNIWLNHSSFNPNHEREGKGLIS